MALTEFTSGINKKCKSVRQLSDLTVNEIKELIYYGVYGLRYMIKANFIKDKDVEQFLLDENELKVVYLVDEPEIKGNYKSLVLVRSFGGELSTMNEMNADIKRFNSIMRDFMLN